MPQTDRHTERQTGQSYNTPFFASRVKKKAENPSKRSVYTIIFYLFNWKTLICWLVKRLIFCISGVTAVNAEKDADLDDGEAWDRQSHVPRLYHITPETTGESKESAKEEAEPQDCSSARQAALEIDRQAPGAGTYIPDCSPNGDYARAQCHRSSPYCWCVHPRTGRPIRGTATQGVKPDCDAGKHKNIKGCSLHKKQEFLDELIKSFSKEMLQDAANRSVSIDTPTAEKAARWKFAHTDANSNGILEKREWRAFRQDRRVSLEGRARRRLRKCWRNLPRFCDENADQKITMDEWLTCTVTVRDSKSNLPKNPRRGKNPLTTILKSD